MARDSLCSVVWLHLSTAVTWKTVGIARANEASVSVVVEVRAAVLLKRCSRNFVPPARIDAPITRRTLPMIEPVIDAFTTPVSPFESAISAMINSAALPKVAFNNPPTPWPRCSASSSVARPIQPAKGIIARQEKMNRAVSLPNCGQIRTTTATGTKISSQLIAGFSNDFMLIIYHSPLQCEKIRQGPASPGFWPASDPRVEHRVSRSQAQRSLDQAPHGLL